MNWQDVVKLLRKIFANSDIQIVVYSLDEQAMSAEGDPEVYAEDEIDRYSEEFHLNKSELELTSPVTPSPVNQFAINNFPFYARKNKTKLLLSTIFSISPKSLLITLNNSLFSTQKSLTMKCSCLLICSSTRKMCIPSTKSMLGKPDKNFTLR